MVVARSRCREPLVLRNISSLAVFHLQEGCAVGGRAQRQPQQHSPHRTHSKRSAVDALGLLALAAFKLNLHDPKLLTLLAQNASTLLLVGGVKASKSMWGRQQEGHGSDLQPQVRQRYLANLALALGAAPSPPDFPAADAVVIKACLERCLSEVDVRKLPARQMKLLEASSAATSTARAGGGGGGR